MVRGPTFYSEKAPAKPAVSGINGQPVFSKILLALPSHESAAIFSKLEFVLLPTRTVLIEAGELIKFAFFVNDGVASILSIMADGKSVGVGLCGREGFAGIPLAAGFRTSPTRVIMQVTGSGFRMDAQDFIVTLRECPKLAAGLQRFSQELALQSSQVAACNQLHKVDERLARWLLLSQDRLGGDFVPLTHEYLAHMLGTRRASVTVAAGILQKAGLITYVRGTVKIENRTRLEEVACECYGTMLEQTKKWQAETLWPLRTAYPREGGEDLLQQAAIQRQSAGVS